MSIATELTLLANSKQAIKNSINQKGGNITDSTPLADYSTAIDNLPSGGSGNPLLTSIDVSDFTGTTFNDARTYITDVTIPSGVTSISYNALQNCSAITSITIPTSVRTIEHSAFAGCTDLTSVNIASLSDWFAITFGYQQYGTTGPSNPLYSSNDSTLYAGGNPVTGTLSIPNTVTEIKQLAFIGYDRITGISFPSSVTRIGYQAFDGCTGLTSVDVPDTVTSISESAFDACTSLTKVKLGNGVTGLNGYTFNACTSLTTLELGSSIRYLGYGETQYAQLSTLICHATTPPTIMGNSFSFGSNYSIYVPAESVDAYKAASNWSTYADRIQAIPEDVKPAFKFTSSVDSSKDITVNCEDTETAGTLTANDLGMSSQQIDEFRLAENTGSVEIGDCVKIYMAAACYTAKGISEVKLNEGLERIGDFAFGGMSALREITIPSTVTNISYQAFYADRALEGITCLATTPPTLGSDVFGDTNNCPIFVQSESVDTYKTAWSQYADRIQAIPAE